MAAQRIYRIVLAGKVRLVRAATPAQAVNHAVRSSVAVSVATQDELVTDLAAGITVESAVEVAQQVLPSMTV